MNLYKTSVSVLDFKVVESNTMRFSCYGNVKGNIDHALDRTLDGAYQKSIDTHKSKGTMPKMFWMHNPRETPIGKWVSMKEDNKGLYLEGEFANTEKGREMYELMKGGHVNAFSIGYRVVQQKWNANAQCNDLIELDIVEVSAVNMPCNEESLLQDIKTSVHDGKMPTKAELREILKSVGWLSKREIERITFAYQPTVDEDAEIKALKELLESSGLCG